MRNRSIKRIAGIFIMVSVVLIAVMIVYLSNGYPADPEAVAAIEEAWEEGIDVDVLKNGDTIYTPEAPLCGFIFYPGGLVAAEAYSPLMKACAEQGIMCVLVKMPFDLAVFRSDAAKGYIRMFPEIKAWYLGGHSLGGAMAAHYIHDNADEFEGLVLLAAYSSDDLSSSDIRVLSVRGTEDGVMHKDKYSKYRTNLPENINEVLINGGNHSGFGAYGPQKGDGIALISKKEQIDTTADLIAGFVMMTRAE